MPDLKQESSGVAPQEPADIFAALRSSAPAVESQPSALTATNTSAAQHAVPLPSLGQDPPAILKAAFTQMSQENPGILAAFQSVLAAPNQPDHSAQQQDTQPEKQ